MTKKISPIDKHKEKDLNLGRNKLLSVINAVDPSTANATAVKNMIESVKLLARMHKALQVDKIVAKAEAKQIQQQAQQLSPEDSARIQEEVREILGRNTAAEITTPLL